MTRITFIFSKKAQMRYISHLDLMRLLTRAMRRAGLPLRMTQGFNPHPRLSLKRALKLGVESESESASILLEEDMEAEEFMDRLTKQLPEGIEIKHAQRDIN